MWTEVGKCDGYIDLIKNIFHQVSVGECQVSTVHLTLCMAFCRHSYMCWFSLSQNSNFILMFQRFSCHDILTSLSTLYFDFFIQHFILTIFFKCMIKKIYLHCCFSSWVALIFSHINDIY